MKKQGSLLMTILVFLSLFEGFAQIPKGNVLIKNAHLLTITQGELENTDLWVKDGLIHKIGKDIKIKNIETIDADGMYVMPGIIDAHSHIALDDINEATNPITAEVQMKDVVNPYDISIYRALAGGTTISHAMHGSANAIGGQNVTLKHRWGHRKPSELIMEDAPRTIKFALGENPIRVHGSRQNIQPNTRMGVAEVIRNGFQEALQYQNEWEHYRENKNDRKVTPPDYSLRLETLADILDEEIIIHCHSYRADEIYMLIKVCQEFGVEKIVFSHANEGFKVAPELAKFSMGASVFSDWWAYKFEVYYSTAYNAAILTENGVSTSINSDSGELIRHLYHEAAKTQRYGGLSDQQALALITINPAKQLGIDDFVGSLEEGKQADLVIFKGHPLSIYAIPQMTFVDGIKYFDIQDDKNDQRLKVDPEQLIEPVYKDNSSKSCMYGTEHF
ncbi:amidohydrolase family protein [Echinicola jeungdonensis]|uniref:Amidohydrolase family protein n=1 Tax=Echinicola jeungdonensis TaxID=709343 RepID=A0ABV5J5C9_9BACT|nr:amidohydrolase family protein [Echinicola jeungdonensis]MDN3670845.1 amidohydrolase family protein [Echinicola jeungdonensis]